jgi:hypothetical protein
VQGRRSVPGSFAGVRAPLELLPRAERVVLDPLLRGQHRDELLVERVSSLRIWSPRACICTVSRSIAHASGDLSLSAAFRLAAEQRSLLEHRMRRAAELVVGAFPGGLLHGVSSPPGVARGARGVFDGRDPLTAALSRATSDRMSGQLHRLQFSSHLRRRAHLWQSLAKAARGRAAFSPLPSM